MFRKGDILHRDLLFTYKGEAFEIVKSFEYLVRVVLTAGRSFSETQNTLAELAQKAIYKLNKYLCQITYTSSQHKLEFLTSLYLLFLLLMRCLGFLII